MPYPPIVRENVSEVLASTPSQLQAMGAFISQGATTLPSGTSALLTAAGDLTSKLAAALAINSLVWTGEVVTATTAAAIPGLSSGATFPTTIAGATPSAYNGLVLATVTGTNTFTYPLVTNPGAATVPGTYTPPTQSELQSMVNSFFGQGTNQGVYVLELGPGDGASGPTALGTFITANPNQFYSFLVPRMWDATANYLALVAQYTSLTAKTYFFTTTTTSSYTDYVNPSKDLVLAVEAPSLSLAEFSLAAVFQRTLSYAPSSANLQLPTNYAYMYGPTPYPTQGNSALLQDLNNAAVSFIATGAQGGLSNTILQGGAVLDGTGGTQNDFSWWYAADWIQIQSAQAAAAAVIQGANNAAAPLYFNQNGINALQAVMVGVVESAVSYGLGNGSIVQTQLDPTTFNSNLQDGVYAGLNVVNAVPFSVYTKLNPNDYGLKKYAGITIVFIPMNSLQQIVFNVLITNLIGTL